MSRCLSQATCSDWLNLIALVVAMRKFDISNQLFALLLSVLPGPPDGEVDIKGSDFGNWEKVHVAHVVALSQQINDVSLAGVAFVALYSLPVLCGPDLRVDVSCRNARRLWTSLSATAPNPVHPS